MCRDILPKPPSVDVEETKTKQPMAPDSDRLAIYGINIRRRA